MSRRRSGIAAAFTGGKSTVSIPMMDSAVRAKAEPYPRSTGSHRSMDIVPGGAMFVCTGACST
ncbi:MAG: hypothetical protein ABIW19_04115 [Vicinamibacterales bacterium]